MEVLVMVGRYAGEIRDIQPFYARGMIERGEALDPNAAIVDEPEVEPMTSVAQVQEIPTIGRFFSDAVANRLAKAVRGTAQTGSAKQGRRRHGD